ncbi:lipopolysaccharide biosynthesis protein [Pseudomonas sp. S5D5]|uniref:lipopolysaccharide biosynthesis protein n=1 Tax=Pseudomonas sp. S5D5 TaxID=2083056 RepID=UPI000D106C94|nr:oligosaccharide flippase family protein [Pseudomonas sp. S5D5]
MVQVSGKERSSNYISQVKKSVTYKAAAVAASFISVPIMLRYLGNESYGIWSTLLTLMSWVVFFDLGIGNGLRNKLAQSIATNRPDEARAYISASYSWIGAISGVLCAALVIASYFVPWQRVFNTTSLDNSYLSTVVATAIFFVLANFWISLINQILGSIQKSSLVVLGQLISNAGGLLAVYILYLTTSPSLLYMTISYGLSLCAGNIALSIYHFSRHKGSRPRPLFSLGVIRPLLTVGLQFFGIQLAALAFFATDKIIITQVFGPESVAVYDVVFKLFAVVTLAQGLILAPLWSAYTDAYHRGDFTWIRAAFKRQIAIYGATSILTIVMAAAAPTIIDLWTGFAVKVPRYLIGSMAIYIIVATWVNIFAIFLNGVQKIRVSFLVSVTAVTINVPLSIYLATHTNLNVAAVSIGTTIALLPGVFLGPYQAIKIIKQKDLGIWSH